MSAKGLSLVAAALVAGVMLTAAPAEAAKNQVYVKNCSQWLHVTVKARPGWRTDGLITQGQYGSNRAANYGDIAEVRCKRKQWAWSNPDYTCNVWVEKASMTTTHSRVNQGNWSFVAPGSPLQSGFQC